eukprot:g4672.t1
MAEKRNRWGAEPPDQGPAPKRNRWGAEPELLQVAHQQPGPELLTASQQPAAAAAMAAMQALKKKQNLHEQIKQLRDQRSYQHAPKLIIDSMGREVDEFGKVIPLRAAPIATLKVNQNRSGVASYISGAGPASSSSAQLVGGPRNPGAAAELQVGGVQSMATGISSYQGGIASHMSAVTGIGTAARSSEPAVSTAVNKKGMSVLHSAKHFDPKVRISGASGRDRRRMFGFSFVQDDKYIKQQEEKTKEDAKKAAEKALEEKKKGAATATEGPSSTVSGNKSGAAAIALASKAARPKDAAIPETVEWWDRLILRQGFDMEKELGSQLEEKRITHYVEHPVPIKPATLSMQKAVKFSNLMRVLGDEQIANPTAIEAKVKRETEQRRLEHEKRNEAAKLAPEERRKKKQQKWDGNTVGGPAPKTDGRSAVNDTHVLAFSLRDVSNKKHLYKVQINAEQFQLTGCLVICPAIGANLLLVEGGKRAITRYRKLITRRIKWTENQADTKEDSGDEDDADVRGDEEENSKTAVLMWQGTTGKRQFDSFKTSNVKTEAEGRQVLASKGAESYWTMLEGFRDANQDL